ncbi:MAG: helix-turn-helix domain-containing protein [Anaerovoracaceae bacterium]
MYGKKIKTRRKDIGITQAELARRCNVNRTALSRWENEENEPSIISLKKLSSVLNISLDELLETDKYLSVPAEERQLIDLFKQVNDDGKKDIIKYANMVINSGEYKKNISLQEESSNVERRTKRISKEEHDEL